MNAADVEARKWEDVRHLPPLKHGGIVLTIQQWHWSTIRTPHLSESGTPSTNPPLAAQYSAWCANNGCHHTKKRTGDWNAEIVWKMRIELDFQWMLVEDDVGDVFEKLESTVSEQFDAIRNAVTTASMPSDLRAQLLSGIDAKYEGCKYGIARAQEGFARDVK
jgi:hypothetical protein